MTGTGRIGEDAACAYLRLHGYAIAERNYRSRFGEIDIIACKNGTTAFVEVKTRGKSPLGTPAQAVDIYKQQKLIKTAKQYIMYRQLVDTDMRFDVIEVEMYGIHIRINHIKNAFGDE